MHFVVSSTWYNGPRSYSPSVCPMLPLNRSFCRAFTAVLASAAMPLLTPPVVAQTAAASATSMPVGPAATRILDSIAASYVLGNRTVGLAAAVVKGPDTLLFKSYGRANVEWDIPMPIDAMFEVGSVAKQFTAVSILQLRDAGKLSIDDDLKIWLPQFDTGGRAITLRHLLNHTSGTFRFTEADQWERNMFLPGVPRDSAYRLVSLTPFQYPTGEVQAYNNAGFWLLGLVVEKASGMKYEDYLAKRVFEPLGMTRSMYCNTLQNVPRRAHGYGMQNGVINRAPMVSYTWVFAPGAVCSTVGDMVTWLRALHGGKLLTPRSYAEMIAPTRLSDGVTIQYGLGIKHGVDLRGLRYIGHGGTAPGFRADVMWYPDAQLGVVVLMNTSAPNLSGAEVSARLVRAVLAGPRPAIAFYTGDPTPFVGTYQVAMGGNQPLAQIEVTASPNGLAFSANGSRSQPLPWVGGLTFHAGETTTLTFRRTNGDAQPATELRRDDAGNHAILRRK